jgi:chaperonin cofactor prefoldin
METGRAPGSRSQVALLRREIADLRQEAEDMELRLNSLMAENARLRERVQEMNLELLRRDGS